MNGIRRPGSKRWLAGVELCLWALALGCLAVFGLIQTQQRAAAQEALSDFHAARSAADNFVHIAERVLAEPDQALWSDARISDYREHRPGSADAAIAVLRIPRLSLEAPVFEGALDAELARGPGRIRGTASIGSDDNIGIAGHRDGFFRVLESIQQGDVIELLGPTSDARYRVTETWVVEPDAVHVLDPTEQGALTLVTCHPFYFVGHAPRRFIVRAVAEPH